MTSMLTRAWLSLRLSIGDLRRHRLHAILVALLVLTPVAATTAILVTAESGVATRQEVIEIHLGESAQARVAVVSPPDVSLRQDSLLPEDWRVETDEQGRRVHSDARHDPRLTPAAVLPVGTPILTVEESLGGIVVMTATGRGGLTYVEGEVWHPSLLGAYTVTEGVAPRLPGEALVSQPTLERLGIGIGGTLTVLEPTARTMTVTGVIDDATRPDNRDLVVAAPGTVPAAMTQLWSQDFILPETSLSWPEIQQLNRSGMIVWSREVLSKPPPGTSIPRYDPRSPGFGLAAVVGAAAAFAIIVLAGAAFMINSRRRQQSLVLLGQIGATPATLWRIMAIDGLLLGFGGGAAGAGLGVLAGYVWVANHDDGNRLDHPGFHVHLGLLAVTIVLASAVCWLAAAVPAVAATRVDLTAALRDARVPKPLDRRWLVLGTAGALTGLGVVIVCGIEYAATSWLDDTTQLLIIGSWLGSLLLAGGLIATAPAALHAISRLLSNGPVTVRLAVHDIVADRRRTTPLVAVIMMTSAIAMITMSGTAWIEWQQQQTVGFRDRPGTIGISLGNVDLGTSGQAAERASRAAAIVDQTLPVTNLRVLQLPATNVGWSLDAEEHDWTSARVNTAALCPPAYRDAVKGSAEYRAMLDDPRCSPGSGVVIGSGPGWPAVLIGEPDDLELVLGQPLIDEQRRFLTDGGALSFADEFLTDGAVILEQRRMTPAAPAGSLVRSVSLPGRLVANPKLQSEVFLTPATARAAGLTPVPAYLLAETTATPTQPQLDRAWGDLAAILPGILAPDVPDDPNDEPRQMSRTALALTLGIVFAAGILAIGLGWIEGRRRRRCLVSIGAPPGVLRADRALEVGILTGYGGIVGTISGLAPSLLLLANQQGFLPVLPALLSAIGLPAAFTAIAAALPAD